MANEVTLNASLAYEDTVDELEALAVANFMATVGTTKFIDNKQSIGTSEEAIILGEVTTPGWSIFINRDPTNYIELRVSTGGAKFATLHAGGGFAIVFLGSGAQVPFAIANTLACLMRYRICSQ